MPDVQTPAVAPAGDSHLEDVNDQFAIPSRSQFDLASVSAPPVGQSVATGTSSKTDFAPRARLRSEAPRPLVIERRAQSVVNDVPQPVASDHDVAHASVQLNEVANSAPFDVHPDQHSQIRAEFVQSHTRADALSAATAPGDHGNPHRTVHIADQDQSRSHIIVDGDSLAKLAARYLDDPQRASEIYELNRDVLSHPDVLPIGAKLLIPSPAASFNSVGESGQSLIPHGRAVHAASRGGLVPVRPIPHEPIVMPRAQLVRPRAVAGTLRVP